MSRLLLTLVMALWAGLAAAQAPTALARAEAGAVSDTLWGRTEIALELSQGVPWRAYTLTGPDRLVIDFRQVDWSGLDPATFGTSPRIAAMRAGPLMSGWSRLVAELAEPMAIDKAALNIDKTSGKARLSVSLRGIDRAAFDAGAGAPADPTWDLPRIARAEPATTGGDGRLVVMLDPGHGGIDPGAQRGDVTEADLMLLFARELRDVLMRTGRFDVRLTRDADAFVSLEGRVAAAHEAGADLFVSLHADALAEGVAHGASVYTLSEEASDAASAALAERHDRDDLLSGVDLTQSDDTVAQVLMGLARLDNTPRSQALARHLIDGIDNALGHVHKRPLRQAGFSVLKAADIPSVLIEVGFLSTDHDLKNLQDPAWRAGMAAGIRDGIAAWALEDAALARLRRQ
ncbi:N-acetylmuramoyl-L-alanine amidase [Thalassococcus sp. CAU 1522]|uniref:N-acetylmuramoyl-L-alanine amidase n=1 Tax=Thalassococcus arenae TaxID=2851652 RepID=A0ABS6NBF6_9RHOB|nr:N-acetylmuramoyl-L-alanine amidase [Thalassococcus arenae]MBV2361007.1 N-acetylmuramoyl-L-alanine amidase [Thalassococcus arenae]